MGAGSVTIAHAPTPVRRWSWRWVLFALAAICVVAAIGTYLTATRPGVRALMRRLDRDHTPGPGPACSRAARSRVSRARGRHGPEVGPEVGPDVGPGRASRMVM